MINAHADHVNWMLVVILVTLALLLALVSSTGGYINPIAPVALANPGNDRNVPIGWNNAVSVQAESLQESRFSELCYLAREFYRAGKLADARITFEEAVAARPIDSGARTWAGITAFREGDHTAAVAHWSKAAEAVGINSGTHVWMDIAVSASYLEMDELQKAAKILIPLERKEANSPSGGGHPVVTFYAGLLYEKLAMQAPAYLDAVEESLGERFTTPLASASPDLSVSPNSRAWLQFLSKRCFQRTIHGLRASNWWAVPVVPWQATLEPSLAPTVQDLLESLGSDDFAIEARRKLRALEIHESNPHRDYEIFDPERLFRAGSIARIERARKAYS